LLLLLRSQYWKLLFLMKINEKKNARENPTQIFENTFQILEKKRPF